MADVVFAGIHVSLTMGGTSCLYLKDTIPVVRSQKISKATSLPVPFDALLGRLFNHTFAMSRYNTTTPGEKIQLTNSGGRHFLGLNLGPDEEVVINIGNLVGFGEKVRFQTYFNTSMPAFACNRVFSTIAKGPGLLVFESGGNPQVIQNGAAQTFHPDLLIAWSKWSYFSLCPIQTTTDIILAECEVVYHFDNPTQPYYPKSSKIPLILDSQLKHHRAGYFNQIKRYLLPSF